ncbi:MAG TPA: hypothetical protein VMF30_12255, partial [Pirellulales bacterium]|nr:hypothetical protein [Pirellulales bacterium]
MASPFSVFRRYQKTLLAVFGVMIMFLFVIGDPISKYIGRGSAPENPVIVKTNSHSYRASELSGLVQLRRMVRNFLQRLAITWVQKVAESERIPGQQIAAIAQNVADGWLRDLMERDVPPDELPTEDNDSSRHASWSKEEADAIQTVVLAAAAEQHGMVVTNDAVNDYLQMITRNL